jgi:hypothetical protein
VFYLTNGGLVSGFRYRDGILPDVTDSEKKYRGSAERLRGMTDVLNGPRRAALNRSIREMQRFVRETEGSTKEEELYLKL